MLVCRGCCCGTIAKHPDVDHDGHLARLHAAARSAGARSWAVDCLGPCTRSNVVVVRAGRRRYWFAEMLDDGMVEQLARWVERGAPMPVPSALRDRVFPGPGESDRPARPMELRGDHLVDFAAAQIRRGATWTIGVHGAVAEFESAGAAVDVSPLLSGTVTLIARTKSGAMRLRLSNSTRAFALARADRPGEAFAVILATPTRGAAHTPATTVQCRGLDVDAIDDPDRAHALYDLGIGRRAASFMVRTPEPRVTAVLDGVTGQDWTEASEAQWQALVDASPDRVVESTIGRIEVRGRIPSTADETPAGAHTHLLPGLLILERDLPPGMGLPPGFVAGAVCYVAASP
jgi:hypothetical protein